MRGDQRLTDGLIRSRISMREVEVLVLGFFMFLIDVSSGFSVVLDPKGRLGGMGERLGVFVKNLRTIRGH